MKRSNGAVSSIGSIGTSDSSALGGEFGAQSLRRVVEEMAGANHVIFSAEKRAERFEIDERADAQFGLRGGGAAADDESARAAFEIRVRDCLRSRCC